MQDKKVSFLISLSKPLKVISLNLINLLVDYVRLIKKTLTPYPFQLKMKLMLSSLVLWSYTTN